MTRHSRRALVFGAMSLAFGCHGGGSGGGGVVTPTVIQGSGVMAEESRPVSGFDRVTHLTEGALYVQEAGGQPVVTVALTQVFVDGALRAEERTVTVDQVVTESLIVRADENLLPYVLTSVQNGTLTIRTAPNVDLEPTVPIELFLEVVTLEGIAFQGIGSVTVTELSTGTLALTHSGVGSIDLADLTATALDVTATGIGTIRASGQVDRQTVRLRGLGPYEAADLQSSEADVLVARADSATVRVSDHLTATIQSSGSVFYIGSPTVDATITGTGQVVQIEP